MRKSLIAAGILVIILVLVGGSLASTYNRLVVANEQVSSLWAQVENQLQRRWDLIPNLVETVRGYASHEREVFTSVAEARAKLAGATTPQERLEAANQLEGALARLLVIVERYPELKADRHFTQLMDELSGTENRLAVERQRFNERVRDYNAALKRFPTMFLARMFGFAERAYFQATGEAQGVPKVTP